MKRFTILIFLISIFFIKTFAQDFEIVNNNFLSKNYQNFINVSGDWNVVDTLGFLDLNTTASTDVATFQLPDFYLAESNTVWNFSFEFNAEKPTSSNYFNIILCSDSLYNGIGVGVGKGNNKTFLSFLQFSQSKVTVLEQSADSIKKNIEYKVTVSRSTDGVWTLFLDDRELLSYAEKTDFDYYFKQFVVKYCFTKKYPSKFILKKFSIYQNYPNAESFSVDSVSLSEINGLKLYFNQILNKEIAQNISNYVVENKNPLSAIVEQDLKTVNLKFEDNFLADKDYQLKFSDIENRAGKKLNGVFAFMRKKITLDNFEFLNSRSVKLVFSDSALNFNDIKIYKINDNNPQKINANKSTIILTFDEDFPSGKEFILNVDGLIDIDGKTEYNFSQKFCFAGFGDIVINEIMADINPEPNNLPAKKYIELYNNSSLDYNLSGYSLSNEGLNVTNLSGKIPSNGYLIVSADSVAFSSYGASVGGLNEKSVTVAGKKLCLTNTFGALVDSLTYSNKMYVDKELSSGGYSLERINPLNFCNQTINWHGSLNNDGGTPGKQNSVFDNLFDTVAAQLIDCKIVKTNKLILLFNEDMDSLFSINVSNYLIDGYLQPDSVLYSNGGNVYLFLNKYLSVGEHYINVKKSRDLCGNISDIQDFRYFSNTAVVMRDVEILDDYCILIHFDGLLDQNSVSDVNNFVVNENITPSFSGIYPKDSCAVVLQFSESIDSTQKYILDVKNVVDCYGNLIEGQRIFGNSEPYFPSKNVEVNLENEVFSPFDSDKHLKISISCQDYPVFLNRIEIYDKNGIKRRTILSSYDLYSNETFVWDGLDDNGKVCSSGIYVVYVLIRDYKPIKKACVLNGFDN